MDDGAQNLLASPVLVTEDVALPDGKPSDSSVLPNNASHTTDSNVVKDHVSVQSEAVSLSTQPVDPLPLPTHSECKIVSVDTTRDEIQSTVSTDVNVDQENKQDTVAPSLPSNANVVLEEPHNSVAPLLPSVPEVEVDNKEESVTLLVRLEKKTTEGVVQDSISPTPQGEKVEVEAIQDSVAPSHPPGTKDNVEIVQESLEPQLPSLQPPSGCNGEDKADLEEESKDCLGEAGVVQLLNQTSGSSDSSSEPSDSEESDSDESDTSSDDSDTSSSCSEIGKILAEAEEDSRKEAVNVVPSEVVLSKNEVKTDTIHIPPVTVKISENDKLTHAGVIHSILEHEVIVRTATSNEDELRHTWNREEIDGSKAFNVDTLMCFENRVILGMVFDTVGPVHAPYYIVRFNTSEEIAAISEIEIGAKVFVVQAHSQVVMGRDVHVKGYDTSNKDDEECDNGEYSDDEEERAARRRKNLMHRRMNVDEEDHRPFKQTRGDAQETADVSSENPYASSPASSDTRRGRFRSRSRGRGRGRGRGGNVGRDAVVGHDYGQPGPYMAMPVPQYGHMAHQILQARLPQHQIGGAPPPPPPPMGYSQTTAGHVQQMPPVYAQASGPYAQPVASMPHMAWNGGQYVQVPVSPMQHYAVQGMGYPGVPQAQMQAMAGMRNMSVGDNHHFPPPVQYPMYEQPPNAGPSSHHPDSNQHGDQHSYYRRQ